MITRYDFEKEIISAPVFDLNLKNEDDEAKPISSRRNCDKRKNIFLLMIKPDKALVSGSISPYPNECH